MGQDAVNPDRGFVREVDMKNARLKSFEGILPAIVSPCDDRELFDDAGFLKLSRDLYKAGVDGLYVCGLTGDGYSMTAEDRMRAAVCAVEASRGRGTVLVHVGAQDTRTACKLAAHAVESGADGVASIPPIHRSHSEILGYYRDLARAASGAPLFVYHIPTYTNSTPTADQFADLLRIDGVVGLKFTDYNLLLLKNILAREPEATVLYGRDEQLLAGLMFGARGGVGSTYNIVPKLCVGIWKAHQKKDWRLAMRIQERLVAVLQALEPFGVIPGMAAVLRETHGLQRCMRRPGILVDRREGRRLARRISSLLEET